MVEKGLLDHRHNLQCCFPTKGGFGNVGGEASGASLNQTEPLSPQVLIGTA